MKKFIVLAMMVILFASCGNRAPKADVNIAVAADSVDVQVDTVQVDSLAVDTLVVE